MSPMDMLKDDMFYVPWLDANGSNWSIYQTWLVLAMDAWAIVGHLLLAAATGTSKAIRETRTAMTTAPPLSSRSWLAGITSASLSSTDY